MRTRNCHQNECGLAVIIVLAMISLMLVFVTAGTNALFQLRREIKLTDQKQRQRWAQITGTNAVASEPAKDR